MQFCTREIGGGGEGGVVDRKNGKVWFKLHSKTKKTLI